MESTKELRQLKGMNQQIYYINPTLLTYNSNPVIPSLAASCILTPATISQLSCFFPHQTRTRFWETLELLYSASDSFSLNKVLECSTRKSDFSMLLVSGTSIPRSQTKSDKMTREASKRGSESTKITFGALLHRSSWPVEPESHNSRPVLTRGEARLARTQTCLFQLSPTHRVLRASYQWQYEQDSTSVHLSIAGGSETSLIIGKKLSAEHAAMAPEPDQRPVSLKLDAESQVGTFIYGSLKHSVFRDSCGDEDMGVSDEWQLDLRQIDWRSGAYQCKSK